MEEFPSTCEVGAAGVSHRSSVEDAAFVHVAVIGEVDDVASVLA